MFQTQRYELAIVNPDGTGFRKLTRTLRQLRRLKWSPNGQWISFERLGRVWVISADGRRQREVARGVWPAWAPDSRRLVFVDQAGSTDPAGEGWLRWGRITVLNLATGRRTVIGRGTMPAWSPDGKRVAFVRYSFRPVMRSHVANHSALFTVASDGSDSRTLYSGFELLVPGSDWVVLYRPAWSPDSRTVAAYGEEPNEGRNALVLLTDVSGGTVRTLVPDVPASFSEVAWSPDGRRLAFTRRGPSITSDSIETVDVVTEARKRVTRSSGYLSKSFDWSPDGRQLAFVRCAGIASRCDLYRVAVADGRTRVIRPVIDVSWDSFDWD